MHNEPPLRRLDGEPAPLVRRLLLAVVLAATCAAAFNNRVYLDFERVSIKLVTNAAEIDSTAGSASVAIPDLSRLVGAPAFLTVDLSNVSEVEKSVTLSIDGMELGEVSLAPNQTASNRTAPNRTVRTRLEVADGATLTAGRLFSAESLEGEFLLRGLSVSNVRGFSSGPFSFVVVAAGRTEFASTSLGATLAVFVALLALAVALGRLSHRAPIRFAQVGLASAGLLLVTLAQLLPWFSGHKLLLSTSAFWICVATIYAAVCSSRSWSELRRLGRWLDPFVLAPSSAASHESTSIHRLKHRLALVLFPALLGPSQVLLFGPHTLYKGNEDDFALSFWTLLGPLLVILLATVALLVAAALACPRRWVPLYVALLFASGLALWLQGSFFPGEYGLLDGTAIDWSRQSLGLGELAAIWTALPLVLILSANRVISWAPTSSALLVVVQIGALGISAIRPSDTGTSKGTGWTEVPSAIFEFSTSRNILHLILDGFQADFFQEIIDDDAALRQELDGFVFFEDHAGAFPTTSASIPAMLTGLPYRNETPIKDFIATQFGERSVFTVLARHGYEVDVAAISRRYLIGPIANAYALPKPYVSFSDHRRASSALLFDLSLFRHAPDLLKRRIYNEQLWVLQQQEWFLGSLSATARIHHASNGLAFLRDLIARMDVSRRQPVYKLIHVGMPHGPVVLDRECNYIGVLSTSRPLSLDQARCTVKTVAALLRRLRELEVYEESLVLLTSDHGADFSPRGFGTEDESDLRFGKMVGNASALLAVKRPQATGPMKISAAQTSITDVPATILDLASMLTEMPGESAFRIDEAQRRVRQFANYDWQHSDWNRDFLPTLELYALRGPLLDRSSWRQVMTVPAPDSD